MVKISFIRQVSRALKPTEIKGLRYAPEYLPDTVQISRKSALSEFKNYLEGWRIHGEDFVPQSANPESTFMEYFNYRKEFCKTISGKTSGASFIRLLKPESVIIIKDDVTSLYHFSQYVKTSSENATPKEYYELVDYIASLMPKYVKNKFPQLRPEIAERSGDIFRWRSNLDVETKIDGELIKSKFFDEDLKNKSINEYTKFVEELTGKKVLIGCPTRMDIAIDELGILNNPENYKDVDYILFGHGTGSSLITDTANPDTWRFSDNNESIWEFIETHVPKGKRVLVCSCEKDGLTISERRLNPQMFDKSGNYMTGIGNPVSTLFGGKNPAKICESGVRHIIGHTAFEKREGRLKFFINGGYGDAKTIYYDL